MVSRALSYRIVHRGQRKSPGQCYIECLTYSNPAACLRSWHFLSGVKVKINIVAYCRKTMSRSDTYQYLPCQYNKQGRETPTWGRDANRSTPTHVMPELFHIRHMVWLTFRTHFFLFSSVKLARKYASSRLNPLSIYVSRLEAASRFFSGEVSSTCMTLDGLEVDIVWSCNWVDITRFHRINSLKGYRPLY